MSISVSPYNPTQQSGSRPKSPPDMIFSTVRAPNTSDWGYFNGTLWLYVGNSVYMLLSTTISPTVKTANWTQLSSGTSEVNSLTVDLANAPGTNPVLPVGGTITITGAQIAAGATANVVRTHSTAAGQFAVEIQRSQAVASSTVGDNGVSHFNSGQFSVDSNGFVSLVGGGQAVDTFQVDASTAPGTNPVIPASNGLVTVTGGQVAAGTTTNVIQTNSLAANTYAIQIQRSQAVASTTIGDNGVCHFDSGSFAVDANGFVTLKGGTEAIDSIAVQAGTSPIVPTAAGLITINGAVAAAGTTPVQTNGTGANTMALQVQTAQAIASTNATNIGLAAFNSAQFAVDANGFVTLSGSSGGKSIKQVNMQVFTNSGTYTPTAGMTYCIIEAIGAGGGGGAAEGGAAGQVAAGGGGAQAGYARALFTAAQIGASQTITINAGGAGGTGAGGPGSNGGTTTVGSLITCNGGQGGAGMALTPQSDSAVASGGGATGGTATVSGATSSFVAKGNPGSIGLCPGGSTASVSPGIGGGGLLGGGGPASVIYNVGNVSQPGTAGSGYGSGGSGGATSGDITPVANAVGGAGASGIVIVTEYIA